MSGLWQDPADAGFGLLEDAPKVLSMEGWSLTYEDG